MKKNRLEQDKMTEEKMRKEENKILYKTIVSTAVKTIGFIFVVISFFILIVSALAPNFAISVFDFVGARKTSYMVYQRIYDREPTNANLYNVLQIAINNDDYQNIEYYAKLMINGDYYDEFCKDIDKATREALDEKYSIYADNYDSYVNTNLVEALYKNGKKSEAKMLAIDSVYANVDEMYVYINCLLEDEKLTSLQLKNEIKSLHTKYGVIEELESRQEELDEEVYYNEKY